MFGNSLKTAIRNLLRQRGHSLINIAGLATGIACCALIYLYISHELSYDNYHPDKNLIYRIASESKTEFEHRIAASTPGPLAPAVKNDFSQVEYAGRIFDLGGGTVSRGDQKYSTANQVFTDSEMLKILSFDFIAGDPETALNEPNTLVLTESNARTIFGDDEAIIGQTVVINRYDFTVTGIIGDAPANTHFKYGALLSMKTLEGNYPLDHWGLYNFHTYIKLRPDSDLELTARLLAGLPGRYQKEELESTGTDLRFFLQPLTGIHLHSHFLDELEPPGNSLYVYLFATVSILILLIACMNYINLTIARSARRFKEIGVRKVLGAQRNQIFGLFFLETAIKTCLSLALSILLVEMFMPLFNQMTGKSFTFAALLRRDSILMLLGITAGLSALAGGYPALILSGYKPVTAIKGIFRTGSAAMTVRKSFVLIQFTITVFLLIAASIVFMQVNYMKNRPLGFDKEQKLKFYLPRSANLKENYQTIKHEFSENSSIKGVTVSSNVPGQRIDAWDTKLASASDEGYRVFSYLYVDEDFIPQYRMEIVSGRNFSSELISDTEGKIIINETALPQLGWSRAEEALGQRMEGGYNEEKTFEIVGVVKDFNYCGLQSPIEPLILEFRPARFRCMTITLNSDDIAGGISFLETKYKELFPNTPFHYSFLDEDFEALYQSEAKLSNVFNTFTFLGLFISCLGLLGLTSITTEKRTKEIGIRKVLGATVINILNLVSGEFLLIIFAANIIAWPLGYLAADKWLQAFAFRVDFQQWVWVFPAAALFAIFLAAATVNLQTLRTAVSNPVDSLGNE